MGILCSRHFKANSDVGENIHFTSRIFGKCSTCLWAGGTFSVRCTCKGQDEREHPTLLFPHWHCSRVYLALLLSSPSQPPRLPSLPSTTSIWLTSILLMLLYCMALVMLCFAVPELTCIYLTFEIWLFRIRRRFKGNRLWCLFSTQLFVLVIYHLHLSCFIVFCWNKTLSRECHFLRKWHENQKLE